MEQPILIATTVADEEKATEIIKKLLDQRIIACAQTIAVSSSFPWMENVEINQQEIKIIVKTFQKHQEQVVYIIKNNHSYKIPDIIVTKIEYVEEEYLKWMAGVLTKQENSE
ncbi:CutA1 divalent ion tolerance protein [Spraguea lophii 42_110]|uniref:CutA1 divalent ion tolerance protein n=1 Tax=Spraguea lophii (strain 42_110) TaxID=1358809 RepID=S7XKD5_SPRLO|nr:CutA1 divalent ion tolerance protein [Spraguea lophii 42_110]